MQRRKNANANSCEQKCVAKDDLWFNYTAFENIFFSLFFFHSYLITSRKLGTLKVGGHSFEFCKLTNIKICKICQNKICKKYQDRVCKKCQNRSFQAIFCLFSKTWVAFFRASCVTRYTSGSFAVHFFPSVEKGIPEKKTSDIT